jgi:allantoinase
MSLIAGDGAYSGAPSGDLVLRGRRVVAGGTMGPAAVHVRGGVITAVTGYDDVPPGAPVEDVGDAVLMPGLVDTHVHVNEPGRAEWEGFQTATRAAMPVLAGLGAPLLAHAELPEPLARGALAVAELDGRHYAVYLASRPPEAEHRAIELLVRLCRETGARVHVVHLADADSLPLLREARAAGLPVTVETCPHYLHFSAESIRDGATDHKCAPPIRDRENRERLWDALGAGDIDLIVTDHSPCPPEMKGLDDGDFLRAWGGVASLQLTLSIAWKGARQRGYTPVDLARWMSEAPARLAGLERSKGAIAAGRDADFVVWHPDEEFVVDPAKLHHRHHVTPYAGATLPGVVAATYLRSRRIYHRGQLTADPAGRPLLRPA